MLADGASQPEAPSHEPRSALSVAAADGPMAPEAFTALTQRIMAVMNTVIDGKEESVRLALTVLLAGGHLLLEDVPGVGKTLLAKTLARTLDCSVNRIQFTPDLLPSDITGVSIFNQSSQTFEFRPGAIFANIVIGDEINRASAKTQSALLESMAEHQVSVDGTTYTLHEPFMVVATQNPIEMAGTYPLPEAQRDRFMARISMGYPDPEAELAMLESHQSASPLDAVSPVASVAQVKAMIATVSGIHVAPAVRSYIVALGQATRTSPELRLGASPRALLQLMRAGKAAAALSGRGFVLPDDIRALAEPVLAHRLLVERSAASRGATPASVVADILDAVAVPGQPDRRPGAFGFGGRGQATGAAAGPVGSNGVPAAAPGSNGSGRPGRDGRPGKEARSN